MNRQVNIVIYRSTFVHALLELIGLAGIVGITIANHRWGSGTAWVDGLAVVLGFLAMVSWVSGAATFRGTREAAIKHLEQLE